MIGVSKASPSRVWNEFDSVVEQVLNRRGIIARHDVRRDPCHGVTF